jgi:hypothetical protein
VSHNVSSGKVWTPVGQSPLSPSRLEGYSREPRISIKKMTRFHEDIEEVRDHYCLKAENDYDEEWIHDFVTQDLGRIERLLARVRAAKLTPEHLNASPHWTKL